MDNTTFIRVGATIFSIITMLATFRLIVPWLVNLHNDGTLIAGFIIGLGVPTALIILLFKVYTEVYE